MTLQLGLVLALALPQDLSVERTAVVPATEVTIDVKLETSRDSSRGGADRDARVRSCGRSANGVAHQVRGQLIGVDGTPWTRAEFVRVLLGRDEDLETGPRVEIGVLDMDRRHLVTRMEHRIDARGPRFDGTIRLPPGPSRRHELALIAENVLLASTPWSPGQREFEIRFEPEAFPGYARSLGFGLFDERGSPLRADIRVEFARANSSDSELDGFRSFITREYREPEAIRPFRWVVAGEYSFSVAPQRSATLLPGSARVALPSAERVRLDLQVVTRLSIRLVPAAEDRLRLVRTRTVRSIDARGFEHVLTAVEGGRRHLDASPPQLDLLLSRFDHRYFGAPRGKHSLIVDSNVIPVSIEHDAQVIHLPRLQPARRSTVSVGPFRVEPKRIEIDVCTPSGVRFQSLRAGSLDALRGRTEHRWTDDDCVEWPIDVVAGTLWLRLRVDGVDRGSRFLDVEDREGSAIHYLVDG